MHPAPHRIRVAQPALMMAFLLLGHASLASVAWVPEYIDRLNVTFSTWGTILGLAVVGAIAPLFFASRLVLRFGSRPIIRTGLFLGMIFLVSLAWITDPILWALSNMLYTLWLSLAGNAINVQAVALQGMVPKPIVPKLHSGWSIGAVLAAVTGAVATVWLSLEIFLVMVAAITIIGFEIIRPLILSPTEDGHEADRRGHVKRKFYSLPPQLWLLAAALVLAVYPEVAIIDWATVFARDVLELELALRALPFVTFMFGMIVGRLSMGQLADHIAPHIIASVGSAVAGIGLLASALLAEPLVAWNGSVGPSLIIGIWFIVGLGIAGISPTVISAVAHVPNVSTAWALSRIQLVNQLATIGAKALMGALAQGIGVSMALLFPVALLLIGALVLRKAAAGAESADLENVGPVTGTITLPIIVEEWGDEPDGPQPSPR